MKKEPFARLYRADGTSKKIKPVKGKTFSLKEMQTYVGGTIDIQNLPDSKMIMILNDDGKNIGLQMNMAATVIWKINYPIELYPFNNDELVVGDVVVCDNNFVK